MQMTLLILAFFLGMILIATWHQYRLKCLRICDLYQKKFNLEIERLLKGDLQQESLKIVHYMIGTIDQEEMPLIVRKSLYKLLQDRFKGIRERESSFFDRELISAMAYWLLAVSYRDPAQGMFIRDFMSVLNDPKINEQWQRKIHERAQKEISGNRCAFAR